jgi:WD40 repeat protein
MVPRRKCGARKRNKGANTQRLSIVNQQSSTINLQSPIAMRVLPGPTKSNQVLAWSSDGRFVAAGGTGDGVTVWDVDAGTPGRRVLDGAHGGRLMRFCPRTGRLYVPFQSGGFWHYDPVTDQQHAHGWCRRPPPHGWGFGYVMLYGFALSAGGQRAVVSLFRDPSRQVAEYSVLENGEMALVSSREDDRWVEVHSFTFRPGTGELFGLGRHVDGELRFEWMLPNADAAAGSFLVPPEGGRVTQWALAPEGERVAWLAEHGLYLQRLGESTPRVLPAAEGEFRRGLAWAPDGRTLAYATGSTAHLLDADTLVEVRAFDWGTGHVRAVAFSPDGLRAAASAGAGRGWVTVFDLE